jgi:hypothetical protein
MTFNIDITIVLVLFALDAASTFYGVTSGKAVEAWPPTKWLMDKIGVVPALVVLKAIAVACFLVPTLTPIHDRHRDWHVRLRGRQQPPRAVEQAKEVNAQ